MQQKTSLGRSHGCWNARLWRGAIFARRPSCGTRHGHGLIEIEQSQRAGSNGFHRLAGLRELRNGGCDPGCAGPDEREAGEKLARFDVSAFADVLKSGAALADTALDLLQLRVRGTEDRDAAQKQFPGIEPAAIDEVLRFGGHALANLL